MTRALRRERAGLGPPGPADRLPAPLPWLLRQARAPHIQLLMTHLCLGGTAAVANVLMARALAPSGRGVIALLLQVGYLCSQLLLLGSERSFVAGYHGSSAAAGVRAYAQLVVRPCAAALGLTAVLAAVVPADLRPSRTTLLLIVVYTLVNVVIQAFRAVAIATSRYTGYLVNTVVSQSLVLATMVGLLAAHVTDVLTWFLAYILANAVPTAACVLRWAREGGPEPAAAGRPAARPPSRARVRREGLALLPAAMANTGMLRFDRLLLPVLASTAALGLYATVATLTELVCWPVQAYADSRLGAWRAAHESGRLRVSPEIARAVLYVALVGPVLGVVTYLAIVPLFGQRYAGATALVAPLIVAANLYAVSRVTLALLIARGRNLLASGAESAGFLASMVGYLALIPHLGALGAAYGSLLGYGTSLVVTVVALAVVAEPARAPAVTVGSSP